ncbi:hypothetical protein GGR56DRAFT_685811 [Xylariaceae sp. FL0804]|nr:hypothetical protein GGR56DRAFT_685811 [Xylariaceae sp. FL0804]
MAGEDRDTAMRDLARQILETRIRPRDEVVALQRLQSRRLAETLGVESLSSPLSLADADLATATAAAAPSGPLHGSYGEYAAEVRRSAAAQQELAKLRAEHRRGAAAATNNNNNNTTKTDTKPSSHHPDATVGARLLQLQLEVCELERERDRLRAVDARLGELGRQPAAQAGAAAFLDPAAAARDPLPALPRALMEGFTRDRAAPDHEVAELRSRLQKAVLRHRLLAQREKRRLDEALGGIHGRRGTGTNAPVVDVDLDPRDLPPAAQLHALGAVKDALVGWIEDMLSRAGEEAEAQGGEEDDDSVAGPPNPEEAQMADVQREYRRHVELRGDVVAAMARLRLQLVETEKMLLLAHRGSSSSSSSSRVEQPPPRAPAPAPPEETPPAFLLTPYLERLQALSREQKALVRERAHIGAVLAREHRDAARDLDRLAAESALLAAHGGGGSINNHTEGGGGNGGGRPCVAARVQPWVAAADASKIATLEAVAERVEAGQTAVEDAMEALGQVRRLLNREEEEQGEEEGEGMTGVDGRGGGGGALEPDLWLGEEEGEESESARRRAERRRNADMAPTKKKPHESIWAKLDGNLGLINE